MNLEFTEQDLAKLNDLIQNTPFKYAYPFFQFFQTKIAETNQKAAEVPVVTKTKKVKADGNQADGQ